MVNRTFLLVILWVAAVAVGAEEHYSGSAQKAELSTPKKWIEEAVARHNFYRAKHGVPNLVHNENLSKVAQAWANKLAAQKGFAHSGNRGLGENLAMQGGTQAFVIQSAFPVDQWYGEIKDYDFGKGDSKNGAVTGHFTQVVWKGSKEVGIAYAKYMNNGWTNYVVVANYFPPGNYIGMHKENVFPAGSG